MFARAGPFESAAELLEPDCRFNPLLNAVSSYVNGVELNLVSVQDSNLYADTGVNWRVAEGYGAAIAAQAAGLPIRLNCPVTLIDHRGKRLAIETALGTVTADAVIVTVPTPLIAAQGIRFRPERTDKVAAASVLPLGLADKLVMTIEAPELLPMDGHLIGNSNKTATGSYHLRPFGRPLIEGSFGGRLAHELEAAGPGALFDFAVAELSNCSEAAFAPACARSSKPTKAPGRLLGSSWRRWQQWHRRAAQTLLVVGERHGGFFL